MKLLIKIPTKGRLNQFLNVLRKYKNLSSTNNVRYLITLDNDDSDKEFLIEVLTGEYKDILTFVCGESKSKVDAINRDLDTNMDWDILMLSSDDMVPLVVGFDDIIINKMAEYYPDTDGVLFFNDGFKKDKLNTLPILGKKYYERFGYIYNPEYKSLWADNEFTEVANILGKQKYFDNVIIRHEHPDYGFSKRDFIHNENLKNDSVDKEVYNKRKKNNFYL